MEEKKFTDGLYFNEPNPNAPEFVIGGLSFDKAKFLYWLDQQQEDAKGYVKVQILRSKAGKPYATLDNYKKNN